MGGVPEGGEEGGWGNVVVKIVLISGNMLHISPDFKMDGM